MDYLTKILNYFHIPRESSSVITASVSSSSKATLLSMKKGATKNEITASQPISDAQITRSNYLSLTKNSNHKVKSGETLSSIAKKYGVEVRSLLALNGLNENSSLQINQELKIPPTRKAKNIKSLNDVAKCLGVSLSFIKGLKKVEDDEQLNENQFHNDIYVDKAGVKTIGIGHAWKSGEPTHLSNAQVLELCANDLLRMEENISAMLGGQSKYEKLPTPMKEALLDMVFNKGSAILEDTPGLLYNLKNGQYEAAINKFTNNKSASTGKEMSGLSKRRLYDISLAVKLYKGKIPTSNLNTAQQVYNKGIALLRQECKDRKINFANMLTGYNRDVKSWFGDNIKLITK